MHGILTGARSGKAPLFAWNGKRTLVTVGDSKTAQGTSTTVSGANTILRYHPNGYQHHLLGLLHQRLHFGLANNVAGGGHTSAQQLALFEAGAVAAHAPGFVIVEVGTNDIVAVDASAEAVMANIEAMCRHNRLIGAYTILSTISVRGSGNGSGWGGLATANAIARRNRINQVNRRILELDLPGVFPVDVNRYWADPASAVRRG